jgi:AcrR family transcriptional regulator
MPTRERRLTPTERRLALERAAARLFAERGYAATTVEDIVRVAELTKPMLYRHYESKQELCVALLERCRSELVAAPLAELDGERADPATRLEAMLDAWLGHVEAHPDDARLLFTPITGDPGVERTQTELWERQRATQLALLREFDPELADAEGAPLAEAMRSALAGVALWWLDHPDVPRRTPLAALLRVAQGAIGTRQ